MKRGGLVCCTARTELLQQVCVPLPVQFPYAGTVTFKWRKYLFTSSQCQPTEVGRPVVKKCHFSLISNSVILSSPVLSGANIVTLDTTSQVCKTALGLRQHAYL